MKDILQHQHEMDTTFSNLYGLHRLDNESYEQFQARMVSYHNLYSRFWSMVRPMLVRLISWLKERGF